MILQVGGSISFAPHTADAKAKWLDYDTRHMLTELDPEAGIRDGGDRHDAVGHRVDVRARRHQGHASREQSARCRRRGPGMWVDAGPAFYLEHLKRLARTRSSPTSFPAHVHQLEIIERLIRAGVYMGPLNLAICGYGGGTLGRNPFDWMDFLRQVPQGAVSTFWSSMRGLISLSAMAIVLGQHVRVGNEDNLWGAGQEAPHLGAADRGRRAHLRGVRPQGRDRRGGARDHEGRRLVQQRRRDAEESRPAAEPPRRREGLPRLGDRRQEDGRQDGRRLASDGLLHGAAGRGEGRDGGGEGGARPSQPA